MRIMALDVGEKNIGVAVSDPLGITAQGLKVMRRSNIKKDLVQLRELVKEYDVAKIVVGYPLNMDGSPGNKAREIMNFKDKLAQAIPLPVVVWDERLTTVSAQRTLLEAGVRRSDRKKVVDKVAAVMILENYLRSKPSMDERNGDRVK
ncbi:MAG: Holliday junction resolvase RuvX [Bacillota bacterium]